MREQCARIGGMAQVFIQATSDKPMIIVNQNPAGKVFAEGVDRCPSNDDASKQQPKTKSRAEISGPFEMPGLGKADNHANNSMAPATSQNRAERLSQSLLDATLYRRR
jgi:hypothetical protein